MDHVFHSRTLRIFPCCFDHISINVISLNIYFHSSVDHILCLFHTLIPEFAVNQVCPFLCCKITVHSRCDIRCDHCCLDREGTTSTKWIDQNPVRFPRSQKNQRRCQCFRDRRLTRHLTVTALVQRLAARIDTDCHLILIEKDAQRIFIARLRHPVQIVIFLHMTGNRLFHNSLDI